MADRTFLQWPFLADPHRRLAQEVGAWCQGNTALFARSAEVDDHCRRLVSSLGHAGWLRYCAPASFGGVHDRLDVRSLCLLRETLAYHSGLADLAFAMQGLGSGPIALFGGDALRRCYLPAVAAGKTIAAFAISEAAAGSDIAAMKTTARSEGDTYVIEGEKTWISNGGIADFYTVFCRYPEGGKKSYIALAVPAESNGLTIKERIQVVSAHPLATLIFQGCRVPSSSVVGEPGKGLGVALGTLDVFRTTVAAASLGFARRALDEAVSFTKTRRLFGSRLAEMQMTQARLADMATAIDASALLVYRAAWVRDTQAERVTREAAMAKLFSTESAQRVVDDAVQLLGARGIVAGSTLEQLYREIRALRIYEGTSEIQKLVIAGQVLNG